MALRAKFLAELKRNAQSSRTSEKKKTTTTCYSPDTSTTLINDVRRNKRKLGCDSTHVVLRDGKSPKLNLSVEKTEGHHFRTDPTSRVEEPQMSTVKEMNTGLVEHEMTKVHNTRVVGFNNSNKGVFGGDGHNLEEIKMTIKQEPLTENECFCSSGNDDLSFLISLLPHIGKIPNEMKLRFRNRVNEVVNEFAYSNKRDNYL